jgi:hypothetical protein
VHRQRTIEYITELENEIFRLRESEAALTSTIKEKEWQLEKLKQDVTPPVTGEIWAGTTEWSEPSWNLPLELLDNFQYDQTNTYVYPLPITTTSGRN